ncbi:hypothetical protein GCM10025781_05910 [Kocuria gwangalliensis]|uniref:Uncharacterized protein n=2 Tax=Kocuria TaxID=57493 RepID=A0A512IFJ3_9MICC|nr:hypothetical protein KTU01_25960 [Kocuria turfanensis]
MTLPWRGTNVRCRSKRYSGNTFQDGIPSPCDGDLMQRVRPDAAGDHPMSVSGTWATDDESDGQAGSDTVDGVDPRGSTATGGCQRPVKAVKKRKNTEAATAT